MAISFECECGQSFETSDSNAGRKTKCGGCGATVVVPGRKRRKASPSGKSQRPAKKRRKRPADDWDLDDDEDYGAMPAAVPPRRSGAKKKAKKKRSASADDSGTARPEADGEQSFFEKKGFMVGMGVFAGVVGFTVAFFVVRGIVSGIAESNKIEVPQEFVEFSSRQMGFACEFPKGWAMTNSENKPVPPWARVEEGDVSITIRAHLSGTAMGDIANATGDITQGLEALGGDEDDVEVDLDDLEPVAQVHAYQAMLKKEENDNYKEGPPEKLKTKGMGEARYSEFETSEAFESWVGIRGTAISKKYQWNIICRCPKKHLEDFKPVFIRVLESLD